TADSTAQLQTFYSTAARFVTYGSAGFYTIMTMASLPTYTDLNMTTCLPYSNSITTTNAIATNNGIPTSTSTTNSITSNGTTTTANNKSNLVIPQSTLVLFFLWISCAINGLLD
ncbi:unnamed protein product, partial [Adineta ricciae]